MKKTGCVYYTFLALLCSIVMTQAQAQSGRFGTQPAKETPAEETPSKDGAKGETEKSEENKMDFATANPEDITNENFPDLIESFDYPNAEISDVIKAISKLTGKNFIVDPGVRGKITIIAPSQITIAEAWKAFLSALAINGFTVVPAGRFLKIKSSRNAGRDAIETYTGDYFPNSDQMITRILKLRYISADEVNKRLRILPSKEGEMTPYEPTNSLIISDYGSNVEKMVKIITELDRPGFEEKLEVIPIKNATAKKIAELVNTIINKGESGGSGRFRSSSRFRRSNNKDSGATKGSVTESISIVTSDDRTNAIIVLGNDAGIKRIQKLVRQLDYPLDPSESGGVYVYYVKNGEAKLIAQTLSGIAQEEEKKRQKQQQTSNRENANTNPAQESRPIFGGDVKIVADENTNSLIITANKQDYKTVLQLLDKIDIAKDQVYVEAIILEMNIQDSSNYNVNAFQFIKSGDGDGAQTPLRVGFSSGGVTSLFDLAKTGAILGFGSGDTIEVETPTGNIRIKELVGFVDFIKTYTESNVLSTPQIIALDNEEAKIKVGDDVPVANNTSTGTNGIQNNSIQFKEAAIELKIKPFISPDSDIVRLNIDQSITEINNNVVQGFEGNAQGRSIREVTTNIVLRDGDTAVIGGLMKDVERIEEQKVPLLGDIPILGWLFRGRSTTSQKVNLMIFLTPRIIRNPLHAKAILDEKIDARARFIQTFTEGNDPHGALFDRLKLGKNGIDEAPVENQPQEVFEEPQEKLEFDLEQAPLEEVQDGDTDEDIFEE